MQTHKTVSNISVNIMKKLNLQEMNIYRRHMSSHDKTRGLMLWLFVGPTGVYLLDFFCSGIQFYLLLSPYICFITLLNLDLYVLGDDALRS